MKKILIPATIALSLFAANAYASSDEKVSDEMKMKITDTLKAQGYEVGKIKSEDGMYEAYAKKDGKKIEVYLNDKMEIVKEKIDD